ncbi:MAG TPA: hypothetical protein VG318_07990 [Actinomycetota bacterium]|nr:hypothetical protein [Actinomycetota bacterium]
MQQAAAPWTPTEDAHLVETFVRYDFPRVGIVEQDGRRFLFGCVDELDELSLWAYVEVDETEEQVLAGAADRTVEHFERTASPISVALAREDSGIVLSAPFLPVSGASFVDAVVASIMAVAEDLREQKRLLAPQ